MKTFIDHITKKLVDQSEKANVKGSKKMKKTELTNFAENRDVRKVIGKYMRTINTMRELLSAISGEQHFKIKT